VTDEVNQPYIYALFTEQMDPEKFLNETVYVYRKSDPEYRSVKSFGRYTFGIKNCLADSDTIYVLRNDDSTIILDHQKVKTFGEFSVFVPEK
jgi:hypothetical protein